MTFDERLAVLRECLADEGDGVLLSGGSIATARAVIAAGGRGDPAVSCDSSGMLCLGWGFAHIMAWADGTLTWAKNAGRRAGKSTPSEVWKVLDSIPDGER